MGFGLVLLGYVIEFIGGLYGYGKLLSVLGCAALYAGLSSLGRYCRLFRRAQYVAPALALVGVYRTLLAAEELFSLDIPFVVAGVTAILNWVYAALLLVFHFFLSVAIKELSMRVNLQKCAVAALRDLVMVAAYILLLLLATLFPSAANFLPALAQLAEVIFAVLYALLLTSCYMRIRPAEEEEETPPPSRFAFVNRFRAAFSRREERAIEADRKWHEEEQKKRLERLSRKQREKQRLREARGGAKKQK